MSPHRNQLFCVSILGAAVALLAGPASAQALSDQLIVRNAAGGIVKNVVIVESATEKRGFMQVKGVKFDASLFGAYTVLLEPGTNRRSDIVGIHKSNTATGAVLRFGFASDNETMGPSLNGWTVAGVGPIVMNEPPAPIDVSKYLDHSAASGQQGWTASFQSDSENPTGPVPAAVPEPAAWTLMLVGFGGLGAALRGVRRRSAFAA